MKEPKDKRTKAYKEWKANYENKYYQAYEEDKKRRLGVDAAQPKRIKYKPISR